MRFPLALRGLAIAIALAGLIDPAVTTMRRTPPIVSVIASSGTTAGALADRVIGDLAPRFAVVRGPVAGAAAVVAVGDRLPSVDVVSANTPGFAIVPDVAGPAVRIAAVRTPARAPIESRVPIAVTVQSVAARGRTLDVTLRHGGVAVDRVSRTVASDAETSSVDLSFVPSAEGATTLAIDAAIGPEPPPTRADVMVDVTRRPWAVLVFDRRPSWMSTFTRRALEADPRFVVTSRVVTSRDLSTDAGRPPATFGDLPSLALFDVVITGAPEALTERDVDGLDAFLRRRGGAVCLLLDQQAPGPYERLLGTGEWMAVGARSPAAVFGPTWAGDLAAGEMAWPVRLPDAAVPIATSAAPAGEAGPARPIVWSAPAGSGRVIVSGALDAWRHRAASADGFDRFWRAVVARAADEAPPLVDVRVERPLIEPGEFTDVVITLRDASLAETTADRPITGRVSLTLETPAGALAVRAWPDGGVGRFRARVRAPAVPGIYRLRVTGDGARVAVPLVVSEQVAQPQPDERDLAAAWATAHGGAAFPASRLDDLAPALERALRPVPRQTVWHPMRSAWWILPFALALGGEWWMRRRGGDR